MKRMHDRQAVLLKNKCGIRDYSKICIICYKRDKAYDIVFSSTTSYIDRYNIIYAFKNLINVDMLFLSIFIIIYVI